jgi:hypothetical protein
LQLSTDLIDWQTAPCVTSDGRTLRASMLSHRFARLSALNLPGTMLDSDGDGLHDLFEEALVATSATDGIDDIGDIDPLGDFDGDGTLNIDEPGNLDPPGCGFARPPLLDPQAVADAADSASTPPVSFEVHTRLH